MEEQKLPDMETPIWQWQSDSYPFKIKDETKWTWQDYPPESCIILEKAFLSNQELADLPDFEIDLNKMLQIRKTDKNKVRRVRRQGNELIQSRFMAEIPEPVVFNSDGKTMNQAFGTIQHFLDYIMKRTPESYTLYQSLKEMPLDSDKSKFQNIIDEVIMCIKKGAEAKEKIIKTRSDPRRKKNHILEAERIAGELKNQSENLKDFLKTILKIYTMETFVCYWINELLRNDNWTGINVLTPYLVCLTYTFKLTEYTVKYEGGWVASMWGYWNNWKLYLYRGSAMTKEQLAQYDMTKVKYFSWNCVTSTSKSLEVAFDFTRQSLITAGDHKIAKEGVVFMIEADFASIEDCEGMIDVSPDSQFPKEEEVILAPGTVFELMNIQLNKKTNFYEINLKVRRKFKELNEDIPLLGALQDQAILKDKAIIKNIPSADSFRILQLLEGNKLIQELEIRDSEIEEYILEIIEKMRTSTNLKKSNIRYIGSTISVSSLSLIAYYFLEENFMDRLLSNRIIFKEDEDRKMTERLKGRDWRIKEMILRDKWLEELHKRGQLIHFWNTFQNEVQIKILDIPPLQNLRMSSEEFHSMLNSIQNLTSLESLLFKSIPKQNAAYLNHFVKMLADLTSLKVLVLDFKDQNMLSDKTLSNLKYSLCEMKSLQRLSLDLQHCQGITDLWHLDPEKASETKVLQYLELKFGYCSKISDKGLNCLNAFFGSMGLLTHLSLDFTLCNQITDDGLLHLKDLLRTPQDLQNLFLSFGGCNKISNQGFENLGSALVKLKNLKVLSLDFRSCNQISEMGLCALETALRHLSGLQELKLEFWHCRRINDIGLNHLKNTLLTLQCLENLSLTFGGCYRISSKGSNQLRTALKNLTSLKILSLDFSREVEDFCPPPPRTYYLSEEFSLLRLFLFILLFSFGIVFFKPKEEGTILASTIFETTTQDVSSPVAWALGTEFVILGVQYLINVLITAYVRGFD